MRQFFLLCAFRISHHVLTRVDFFFCTFCVPGKMMKLRPTVGAGMLEVLLICRSKTNERLKRLHNKIWSRDLNRESKQVQTAAKRTLTSAVFTYISLIIFVRLIWRITPSDKKLFSPKSVTVICFIFSPQGGSAVQQAYWSEKRKGHQECSFFTMQHLMQYQHTLFFFISFSSRKPNKKLHMRNFTFKKRCTED